MDDEDDEEEEEEDNDNNHTFSASFLDFTCLFNNLSIVCAFKQTVIFRLTSFKRPPRVCLVFGEDKCRNNGWLVAGQGDRLYHFFYFLFLSDAGPTLETLDNTIRIGSTPTFLYFDLYLYSAYAAHYV